MADVTFELSMNTDNVEKDAKNLNKELNAIFKVTSDKELSSKIQGITNRLEKQQYTISKTLGKIDELSNKKVYSEDYKKLNADAEKLRQQLLKVSNEMNKIDLTQGDEAVAKFNKLSKESDELSKSLADVTSELQGLYDNNKVLDLEGMEKNEAEIENLRMKVGFLNHSIEKTVKSLYEADNELAEMVYNSDDLTDAMDNTAATSKWVAEHFHEMKMTSEEDVTTLGQTNDQLNQFVSTFAQASRLKTAENIADAFKKLLGVIVKVNAKILELAGKGLKKVGGALKNVTKNMLRLNKETATHDMNLKKAVNTMLKYGLGIRSVFILWRKLRAYAQDALKLMAQQFEEIDKTVSNIINSFNQFKNSVGTMVEPLMTTFAPAIETVLGLLTRANEALANFFAILTGQKYIYKAKKSNDSYAESLNKVSKAAKDAKEDIAAYDKLLVINRNDANGNGNGSGDDDEVVDAFERTLADSPFAEQVKKAISEDDWEEVGTLFADKLNIITSSLHNWIINDFAPASKTWAKRLGDTLNGGIATYDWNELGITIGAGTNAIFDAFNTFYTTFDGYDLGKSIADTVSGWFDEVNWELVGQTFGNKLNLMWSTAYGFMKNLDWGGMGDSLGTLIKSWAETVDTATIGNTIVTSLNGVLTFLKNSLSTIPWETVGEKITDLIMAFFKPTEDGGFDARAFAEVINTALNGVLDTLITILDKTDWEQVGTKIVEFIKGIDWVELLTKLGRTIAKGLKGAIIASVEIMKKDPFVGVIFASGLIHKLSNAIGGLGNNSTLTSAAETAGSALGKCIGAAMVGYLTGNILYELVPEVRKWADNIMAMFFGDEDLYKDTGSLSDKIANGLWSITEGRKAQKEAERKKKSGEITPNKSGHGGGHYGTNIQYKLSADISGVDVKKLAAIRDDIEYIDNDNKPHITEIDPKVNQVGVFKVQSFQTLYDSLVDKTVTAIAETTNVGLFDVFKNKIDIIPATSKKVVEAGTEKTNLITAFKGSIDAIKDVSEKVVKAVTKGDSDVKDLSTDISKVQGKTVEISVTTTPFKTIIGKISEIAIGAKDVINKELVDKLNALKVQVEMQNVASAIAGGINATTSIFKVPKLAQGAVIPANREFLAVLGDQKQGTNVEAPLDTIVKAMQIALDTTNNTGNKQDINLYLDGKQISKVVWNETEKRYKQSGMRFA